MHESWEWKLKGTCSNDEVLFEYMRESKNDIFYDQELRPDGKKYCIGCPVRDICLSKALEHPEWEGVWGGTTQAERNHIRRKNSGIVSKKILEKKIAAHLERWNLQLPDDKDPIAS